MLIFTNEQQQSILGARRVFNERMARLEETQGARPIEGNAIAIPLDAWRRIDSRVQTIARTRLQVFNRLAAASQTPVDIADLVNYYPQVSDSGDVTVTMDGRNDGKADQAITKFVGTPVPLFTNATRFGWRQMAVLRKGGGQIDTASFANAQRKIADKMEDMALNGLSSVNVGGDTIYGLRNFPQRNTFIHGFTLATATGAQWVTAMKQAIAAAMGDNQYGRITLFINQGDYTAADTTDYVNGSNVTQGTILQRLMTIGQIKEIVPAASVPVNEILGVVDLEAGEWGSILTAMPLTSRPKTRLEPEDDYVFGNIAAAAPQFRSDYIGQSPFLHGTSA